MANDGLRQVLRSRGLTQEQLADRVGVDVKTVARWLAGTMRPSVNNQRRIADAVEIDDISALWPDEPAGLSGADEILEAWPHRADVPTTLWRRLLRDAQENVDVLGYAALFLLEQDPSFVSVLEKRAAQGMRVRIALGDPSSEHVSARDEEEGLPPGSLATRIGYTLKYLTPLRDTAGIDIGFFDAPLYQSVFRFDSQILYTPHLYGRPGFRTICFHVEKRSEGGLATQLIETVDAVWRDIRPVDWSSRAETS